MKYLLLAKSSFFLYLLQSMPYSQSQTVVVENPMSVDESGKLVSIVPNFYFQSALSPLLLGGIFSVLPFLRAEKGLLIRF